jgi:hypothetical protein
LAARVAKEGGSTEAAKLEYAFLLAMSRLPDTHEQKVLAQALARYRAVLDKEGKLRDEEQQQAWLGVARTLLNSDEFLTRE